jgi:hypothetical protein
MMDCLGRNLSPKLIKYKTAVFYGGNILFHFNKSDLLNLNRARCVTKTISLYFYIFVTKKINELLHNY